MSRPPRRKRIRRTFRWEGCVTDVEARSFSAHLVPTDHQGPEMWAEFDINRLPSAEPGLVFNLYVHQRGHRSRTLLRERDFGRWTREELDAARARAAEWVERMAPKWLPAS